MKKMSQKQWDKKIKDGVMEVVEIISAYTGLYLVRLNGKKQYVEVK